MKKPKKVIVWVGALIGVAIIVLSIVKWDTTKDAVKDAWNGEYNPPSQQVE